MTRVALIDYGIGNLRSVQKALEHAGAQVTVTADPASILAADKVVLPGVGAFGDGMKGLRARGLPPALETLVRRGVPLLGICVGMQVLFEESYELGQHAGLGFLPGAVKRFADHAGLKVPQTGWNQLHPADTRHPLFTGLPAGAYAYFNHSYYCDADPTVTLATTDYGGYYPSMVARGRLYGIQFHPEKSQHIGLLLLRNFIQHG